ncbi:MAG: hypothetical protein Q4C70_15525, partial [Planctomycetia bacterium]|nr:hypothetical protein [Planctomycetia bacterium]
ALYVGNTNVRDTQKYTLSGENAKLDVDGEAINYGIIQLTQNATAEIKTMTNHASFLVDSGAVATIETVTNNSSILIDNGASAEIKTMTNYGTVLVDNDATATIGTLTNRNNFTVQGGATVTVTGDLGIKAATTSVLENGVLNVKNLLVGNSTATDGSFVVNGADAVVNAETLKLGNNDTAATMTLNAGTVTLTNVPYFGNAGAGKVTYNQTGGKLQVVKVEGAETTPQVYFGFHTLVT